MPADSPAPLTLPLVADAATLELVGGKGAELARLAAAGFSVPAGFHVTTAAYRRFVADTGLQQAVETAIDGVTVADPATLERAAAAIRGRFERTKVPVDIATAIRRAYADLGGGDLAVAVRSSATAEDLPEMSFAGQQESYLNVRGEAELLRAVRRGWASLWTARAIGYRERTRVDQRSVAMGVVVQRLVPAAVSGIIFTANPTTGARNELVVDASFGLGEAIVSGEVTPDTYVLDRDGFAVKQSEIGAKAAMIVAEAGQGTTRAAVPESRRGERALSDRLLRSLAALAVRVEQACDGVPQDVEWAIEGDRLWLLQARPITTLPPEPLREVRWEPPTPGSAWLRRQVVENMPEPLSPLFDELYLRNGLNHSFAAIVAIMGLSWVELDLLVGGPMFTTINGYAYSRGNFTLTWKWIPKLVAVETRVIRWFLKDGATALWRDDSLPSYLAAVDRWKAIHLTEASDEDLLRGIRELSWADAEYWFACAVVVGAAKVTDALLDTFLGAAARGRGLTSGRYLRGFPSKTLTAEAALEELAGRIRASAELRDLVAETPADRLRAALTENAAGRGVLAGLDEYFERYGHQVYNLDFAVPTQVDDPLPVLFNLKSKAQRPSVDVMARRDELARRRDADVAETARSFDPVRRRLFLLLVRLAQRFGPYREESLFYIGAAWPTLRRLALELGRRLVTAGSLEAADDVFYLESGELAAASAAWQTGQSRPDLARLARDRRDLREARKRLRPPAAVPITFHMSLGGIDLSAFETQQRNLDAGATLRGFAVSPGRVTAPASVIRTPADFERMEPDSILVCPTTTPAWTPLFGLAGGLVTDVGGILAHGSIVAREYGLPAVLGTGNATDRIAHGQVITVDGDAGTVTLSGVAEETVADQVSPSAATSANARWRWLLPFAVAALAATAGSIWWRNRRRRRSRSGASGKGARHF